MVRITFVLLLFITSTHTMSQNLLQFTNNGVIGLSINQPLTAATLPMKPIQKHPRIDYIEYHTNRYRFFFLENAAQYKTIYDNPITDLFAAVDSTNTVKAITVLVTDTTMTLEGKLDSIFGKKSLRSASEAEGFSLNSHSLWGVADILVFFSRSTMKDNGITAVIKMLDKDIDTIGTTPMLFNSPRVKISNN